MLWEVSVYIDMILIFKKLKFTLGKFFLYWSIQISISYTWSLVLPNLSSASPTPAFFCPDHTTYIYTININCVMYVIYIHVQSESIYISSYIISSACLYIYFSNINVSILPTATLSCSSSALSTSMLTSSSTSTWHYIHIV